MNFTETLFYKLRCVTCWRNLAQRLIVPSSVYADSAWWSCQGKEQKQVKLKLVVLCNVVQ